MQDFDDIALSPRGRGRRDFLSKLGIFGAGAIGMAAVGCSDNGNSSNNVFAGGGNNGGGAGPTIFDPTNFPGVPGKSENGVVLNYALTLEDLEADLYRQALNIATGRDKTAPLLGSAASYTNLAISPGNLSSEKAKYGLQYLAEYTFIEKAHAKFLRDTLPTLGETPVSPRATGYKANFGSDFVSLLTVIRGLEEEGVRAYLGAAGFLTDLGLIQVATTIYSTEARHSAVINYILGLDPGPAFTTGDLKVTPTYPHTNTFEYYRTPTQVLSDIQPFLA
jgi:hypothetical protein